MIDMRDGIKTKKLDLKYLPADREITFNNDPSLEPITLTLPEPPPLEMIRGYGKKPEEQRYERHTIPYKLIKLEEDIIDTLAEQKYETVTQYKISREFWKALKENYHYYEKEINFIKEMWYYRLYGEWVFILGKPYWIPPWHFMYVNFWYMPDVKGNYPDYRDRDRREFIFDHYTYTCTETFEKLDKDGRAIPEPDGSYKMIDLGKRLCYGVVQNKNRRCGRTHRSLSEIFEIATRTMGTDGVGIMSYNSGNAEEHYRKKLLRAWHKYPIFFKPYSPSSKNPKTLLFDTPSNEFIDEGLECSVSYAESANSKAYDGKKLIAALLDEEGKTVEVDVNERWDVVRNCLSQGEGSIIHGYSIHPSTAEEYTEGGKAYREMTEGSNFYQRVGESGQTESGLFLLFNSGADALDGYIDSYGFSVIGELKDYQIKEGFKKTADQYLKERREYFLNKGDEESMRKYRALKKQFPIIYSDSWIGETGDIGWDIEIIDKRLAELNNQKKDNLVGNFMWVDDKQSAVEFVYDPEGRFEISKLLKENANRRTMDTVYDDFTNNYRTEYRPEFVEYNITIGVDPFKFKKRAEMKKSKRNMSDGAINVFLERDKNIDKSDNPLTWKTYKPICIYKYRPATPTEFAEDVIKCAVWYNGMIYPETNVDHFVPTIKEMGYGGYLKYDLNQYGEKKETAGSYTSTNKQDFFMYVQDYIKNHGHRIEFISLLNSLKEIPNMDALNDYDDVAAFMMALKGVRSRYTDMRKGYDGFSIDVRDLL